MRYSILLLAGLLDLTLSRQCTRAGIAVIIGNTKYTKSDVPPVDFAGRDAKLMREYLIRMFGYREGNIIYAEDATQADFN